MNSRPNRSSFFARRSSLVILDLLLLFGAVVLFYPKVGLPNAMSPGGDMLNLMVPARYWAARWLGRGIIPLWNPETFGGVPFLGAMQAGVFYPPNLVLGAFLPPPATINLLRLAHIYLLGALTWLFLRFELGHARPAALLGAIAVAGSAHVASHTDHINQLAAMAWLPALVFCQWRFWRTGSRAALAGFAMVLALQALAGHPQAVFYSLLLNGAIAAAWFIRGSPAEGRRGVKGEDSSPGDSAWSHHAFFGRTGARARFWPLALVGIALFGGLLLAAIQVIPTVETARFSRRVVDGPDYPLWLSMPRRFIRAVITPRAFGAPLSAGGYTDPGFASEFGSFVGRTTLLFAALAVIAGIARRRLGAVFWALVVAVAFVLALGGFGPFCGKASPLVASAPFPPNVRPSPVFRAYLRVFPPARHLRVPPRILLLATFGLAVLGSTGLDWVLRRHGWSVSRSRRWLGAMLGWGAVGVTVLELWSFQRGEYHNRVVPYHSPDKLLAGRAGEVLSPLFSSTVPGEESRGGGGESHPSPGGVRTSSLSSFRLFRLMVRDPDYLMDPRPAAVRNRCIRLQPNLGMMLGVGEIEGYEEGLLPPIRYFDFLNYFNRNLRSPDPDAVLLGLMNVRFLYVEQGLPIHSKTWRLVGEVPEPVTGFRYRLYENPLWLPRVLWTDWLRDKIALGELRGTYSRGGRPSPRVTDRVQRYCLDAGAIAARGRLVEPGKPAALRVRAIEPNRIEVENVTGRGGEILVVQNAYPGWVIEAAGETVPLRPKTDFAGAASVPPGARRITVVYRPFSFRLGAYLSGVALAIWLAAVVAGCCRSARPAVDAASPPCRPDSRNA